MKSSARIRGSDIIHGSKVKGWVQKKEPQTTMVPVSDHQQNLNWNFMQSRLPHQIPIPQSLPVHALGYHRHLVNGVQAAKVVSTGELINVSLEMLDAHTVIGAVVSTLEKTPEEFYPIGVRGVRFIVNVLATRVFDRLMGVGA